MNEALSNITLAQVALAAVAIWGVVQFGGRLWSYAVRVVHFIDKLESIERQVHANGGSSLRDAVDQVASTQGQLAQAQVAIADETRELRTAFEQHVASHDTESHRQARRADDPPDADYRPAPTHREGDTP